MCCCCPKDPRESFDFAADAFDLAERLQTPIFVMMDLDIGMNDWLCKPLTWDDSRNYDRGKIMTAEELEAGKDFGRYLDVDGDAIPYRTLPGEHPTRGAYFTRGTSRDPYARYSEDGSVYVDNMQRLLRKFETAKSCCPSRSCTRPRSLPASARSITARRRRRWTRPCSSSKTKAIISTRCACAPSPSPTRSSNSSTHHEQVFVVEQNRDAQLMKLLVNECAIDPAHFISIVHYDGTPITARFIKAAIAERLGLNARREAAE